MNEISIAELIKAQIQDAEITVWDITGTRDHWGIKVVSDVFKGQPLIERHRRLHQILAKAMEDAIHAVKFKTLTYEEDQQKLEKKKE